MGRLEEYGSVKYFMFCSDAKILFIIIFLNLVFYYFDTLVLKINFIINI